MFHLAEVVEGGRSVCRGGFRLGVLEVQHLADAVGLLKSNPRVTFDLSHLDVDRTGLFGERQVLLTPRFILPVGQLMFHRDQFLTDLGSDLLGGAPEALDPKKIPHSRWAMRG
nr:hypothetical protein [Seohaeicola saemankumensis]